MKEELTIYEILVLTDKHFDEVNAVWTEMAEKDPGTMMYQATIEWARRNGREIVLKDSKICHCHANIEVS